MDRYKKVIKNPQTKKDIRELKKKKRQFRKDTLSARNLRVDFNLTNAEISKIKSTKKFGEVRYKRENILKFFKGDKDKIKLFRALDSKQISFLEPEGKNRQGKLFIKV